MNPTTQAPPKTTAVATRPKLTPEQIAVDEAKALLLTPDFSLELKKACSSFITPERQLRVFLNAIIKNPKLALTSPESRCLAMLQCATWGLEANGYHAHLIPYGNTCQLILDYKGYIEILSRSEVIDFVDAVAVHANDKFCIKRGLNPDIIHEPEIKGEPGEFIGAYVIVRLKGVAMPKFDFMRVEEIEKVRARSKAANSGPWVTDFEEMAKKTVLHRIKKTLPVRGEPLDILRQSEEIEFSDEDRFARAKPAKVRVSEPEPPTQPALPLTAASAPAAPVTATETLEPDPAPVTEPAPAPVQRAQAAPTPRAAAAPPKPAAPAPAKPITAKPAATPPPAPASPAAPSQAEQDIENLNQLCDQAGISPAKLVEAAKREFKLPPDIESIAELVEVSPKKAASIIENFDDFVTKIS